MVIYKYDEELIWKKIATAGQAHCLFARSVTRPKPAKELALPSHRLKGRKHETLTANISKLGFSGLRKVCTFNKILSGLIGKWLRKPSLLILANRYSTLRE